MKLRPEKLRLFLERSGARDPDVVLGPRFGEDAAVVRVGSELLVVHSDPITGASELLGWLAVHIPCNDVAVTGARPRWLLVTLLLPEGFPDEELDRLASRLDSAAKSLGVSIVGGHTEYAPGLDRPIASSTAIGVAVGGRFVPTGGAKPGDVVIATKFAGIEAAAILATDFREMLLERGVPRGALERAARFYEMVSVVGEALALAERGLAHAMHDPTEGGLLGGLLEMAYASHVTIEVWEDKVPMDPDAEAIFKAAGVDPLKSLSSGMLLAAVPADRADEALEAVESVGVKAAVVGRVREYDGVLVRLYRRSGAVEEYDEPFVEDEIMRLWEESG